MMTCVALAIDLSSYAITIHHHHHHHHPWYTLCFKMPFISSSEAAAVM